MRNGPPAVLQDVEERQEEEKDLRTREKDRERREFHEETAIDDAQREV